MELAPRVFPLANRDKRVERRVALVLLAARPENARNTFSYPTHADTGTGGCPNRVSDRKISTEHELNNLLIYVSCMH